MHSWNSFFTSYFLIIFKEHLNMKKMEILEHKTFKMVLFHWNQIFLRIFWQSSFLKVLSIKRRQADVNNNAIQYQKIFRYLIIISAKNIFSVYKPTRTYIATLFDSFWKFYFYHSAVEMWNSDEKASTCMLSIQSM